MPDVQEEWEEAEEPISLGGDESWAEPRELGPDDRDRDLMDGSWEQQYYSGRMRSIDWHNVTIAIGLLALLGITLPAILVFFR